MTATTKEFATEAGVAEGTIFRVFDTKEALVEAALIRAFDPAPLLTELTEIDLELPLRPRLVAMVTTHQQHLVGLFELMASVGMVRPPEYHRDEAPGEAHTKVHEAMLAVIGVDSDRLRLPSHELLRVVRMLTFAGSHRHIAHGSLLTPQQIVDVLLDGALKSDEEGVSC